MKMQAAGNVARHELRASCFQILARHTAWPGKRRLLELAETEVKHATDEQVWAEAAFRMGMPRIRAKRIHSPG
jgi:hypothetical protein